MSNSNFLAFPWAQTQTLFLGLSQAQAKLKLLIFPDESSLNMHYSIMLGKLSSFTALPPFLLCRFQFSNQITEAPQSQQKSCEVSIELKRFTFEQTKSYKTNPLSFKFFNHKSFLVNGNRLRLGVAVQETQHRSVQ